jgi:hypothetical protein
MPVKEASSEFFRPLREGDVNDVVSVYRRAFGDARPIDAQELLSWLHNPELDPESLRVLEVDGSVVGYGDVSIENGDVALEVAAPGYWGTFLEWAEDTARRERASRVRVLSYAGGDLADAAKSRGYRLWRSNYTMRIELGDAIPDAPDLPAGIELRSYWHHDATDLRAALNEAFANDPFSHEASDSYFREFYLHARADSIPRSGCSRGTTQNSRASSSLFPSGSVTPISVP